MNEETKSEDILPEEVEKKEEINFEEENKTLKEQLAKEQEEKENYKQMGLKYKEEAKEEPVWDEDSQKFQKQTLSRAEQLAEEKARKTVEDFNEKAGIAKFQELHPDVVIKDVLANYQPKHGKYSADSVTRDLERAYVLHQYDSGKLSSEKEQSFEKGKKKGAAESKLADLNAVSTTSQKTAPQGKTLTDGEIQMAKRMKVDPEKLAEEDMSEPATIEIN